MYDYKVKINRVVDGDTIDVDIDLGFDVILKNQRVRLDGIDAPETRTRDLIEKKFGYYAKEYVEEFLCDETVILRCKKYNDTGSFDRILGDLYVNDISLCETMIMNNVAVIYDGQRKDQLQENHLKNRQILIDEGLVIL